VRYYFINYRRLFFLLIILVSICLFYGGIVSASSKILIRPRSVLFHIKDEPSGYIPVYPAYNSIEVTRKKYTGDVYYIAGEIIKVNNPGQGDYAIPPEYLLVDTPYTTEYMPMDTETLFLAAGDSNSRISFKLLRDVWYLVPAGVYIGHLTGTNVSGLPIVDIVVKKRGGGATNFSVSPESIMVNADEGPGLYPAEESINVIISSYDNNWILNISANPLIYSDDENIRIEKEDMFMAVNSEEGPYNGMNTDLILYGNEYGASVDLDLYLKIQTRWEHGAGDYNGDICFTFSGGEGEDDQLEFEDEFEEYIEDDDED